MKPEITLDCTEVDDFTLADLLEAQRKARESYGQPSSISFSESGKDRFYGLLNSQASFSAFDFKGFDPPPPVDVRWQGLEIVVAR